MTHSLLSNSNIPLIELPNDKNDRDSLNTVSSQLVDALQTSGFLLLKSSEIPPDLQASAIRVAASLLVEQSPQQGSSTDNSSIQGAVIDHPTDPKRYLMFNSLDEVGLLQLERSQNDDDHDDAQTILVEYWKALERVKRQLLTCLAIGLELEPDFFVRLHSKDQSALRLLHYPASSNSINDDDITSTSLPVIRCKPHSDYGSVTLLLTDGVPGLEALIDGEWIPVPHVQGALVVNIGSLLQGWTNGKLLATLHRVVAPPGSQGGLPRTSLAFFADPDPDVSTILQDETMGNLPPGTEPMVSVADYIKWRSGGEGSQRTGLAFSQEEELRVNSARMS